MAGRKTVISWLLCTALIAVVLFSIQDSTRADDLVEFLNGSKQTGVVKEIRQDDREFDFEVVIAGKRFVRTYAFNTVHAVTLNNKRYVVTPKNKPAAKPMADSANPADQQLSRQALAELIETTGGELPSWWDSVDLNYPQSLDLSWPLKPEGNWNNQKNVGQFIWDVINPNPNRWRPGIKLVTKCMESHEGNQTLLTRDMKTLGRMYFTLLQDYARAAYWFQKAGIKKGEGPSVQLAECYWRLGNTQMAVEMVSNKSLPISTIKLYGDMGNHQRALQLANAFKKNGSTNPLIDQLVGDALRNAKQYDDAIRHYQLVISSDKFRNEQYENREKSRARESINAIELFERAEVSRVSDGTYQGVSTGYSGQVKVAVSVAGGQIKDVKVIAHRERQFYSSIEDTTKQILDLQSVQGIDGTTGATITSQAIVNASARALSQGAK